MDDIGLVADLAIVAVVAVIGGSVARLLKLPSVIGYLAAGIAIGPHTPGPAGDIEEVQTFADLAVALLMFTLGVQFSVREIRDYRSMALLAGAGATVAVMALGFLGGSAVGLNSEAAVVIGMAAAVSSSMLAIKLIDDHGLLGATAGRLTVVTSLVNDLAVVFMLATIPALAGNSEDLPRELALALLKGAALLAGVAVLGIFVVPLMIGRLAASRARELFIVSMLALALGTAALSAEAGLSVAFGAFVAGLLLSESEYAHRTLAEMLPVREIFVVVFFVSIGMLIDPAVFRDEPELVAALTAVAVIGKIVLISGAGVVLRYPMAASLATGIALGSMGEFSFLVGREALREGVISVAVNDAILASVLVSIFIAPLLFAVHERAIAVARAAPIIGPVIAPRTDANLPEADAPGLFNHAIIVGYTQAGRALATALTTRGFRWVVIDQEPLVFQRLKERGANVILGDASLPTILTQAAVQSAWVLAITVPNPGMIETVAATGRGLNRRIDVVARADTPEGRARLRRLGVGRTVDSEFEAASQFVSHTLQRFGISRQEVQTAMWRLRQDRVNETDRPAS